MKRIVLDASTLVSGLRSRLGASFAILRLIARGEARPVATTALYLEYEAVLKRREHQTAQGLIGGCVAAVVLQRRGVADEGAPLNFPFTEAAAAVGVVSMVWIAAQETWQEVLCGLGRGWGRESCLLGLAQADRTHRRLGSVALLTNQPFQSRPMSPNSEG